MIHISYINILDNDIEFGGFIEKDKIQSNDNIMILLKFDKYPINDIKRNDIIRKVNLECNYFNFKVSISDILDRIYIKFFSILSSSLVDNKIYFCKNTRLYDIENSYFFDRDIYIIYLDNNIVIEKKNMLLLDLLKKEVLFLKSLLLKSDIKIIVIRIILFFTKLLYRFVIKKEIWIFIDRLNKADDNAEVLFEYLTKKNNKNIKKYFVIEESSFYFNKLSEKYKVVPFGKWKYKLLMILADKVISSHIDELIRTPFDGKALYLRSLIDFKFVFLQHGVIKDDLSDWLNKYNKNISLFITSSKYEYDSIINGAYLYDKNIVKLTGLPRYDKLLNKCTNKIIIMPTWRKNIVNSYNTELFNRPYREDFKYTIYFEYYNRLINDERIINFSKRYGYEIIFFPHPDIQQQLCDFKKNDYVTFLDINISYNKVFCESSLLITDYSSVAFDFAYLKKPVLYFQFDYEEVFKEKVHLYSKGYFDYETMGFGEVYYKYEELVISILGYIETGCNMKQEYKDRVDKFFAFKDKNNCERVYNEILNMKS